MDRYCYFLFLEKMLFFFRSTKKTWLSYGYKLRFTTIGAFIICDCMYNALWCVFEISFGLGVWSLQKLHKIRKYLTFCCSFLKLIHKQECTVYYKIFFHEIILTFIEGYASKHGFKRETQFLNFTTLFNSFRTLCLLK